MKDQANLFDTPPLPVKKLREALKRDGARRRDEAINRVERAAPQSFLDQALEVVMRLAKAGRRFTTDDVWDALPKGIRPEEPRAMGAVLRKAQHLKIVAPQAEYRASLRPECHRNPKRVWAAPSDDPVGLAA